MARRIVDVSIRGRAEWLSALMSNRSQFLKNDASATSTANETVLGLGRTPSSSPGSGDKRDTIAKKKTGKENGGSRAKHGCQQAR